MKQIASLAVLATALCSFAMAQEQSQGGGVVVIGVKAKKWCKAEHSANTFYMPRIESFDWDGAPYPITGSHDENATDAHLADIKRQLVQFGYHTGIAPWRNANGDLVDENLHWLVTPTERISTTYGDVTSVLAVPGGTIFGWDAGEWEGELRFIPTTGQSRVLVDENTHAILEFEGRIYALTGLAHMRMNHGALWRVDLTPTGPDPHKVADLPGGAPEGWAVVDGKAILVATVGEDIAILPDETIDLASANRPCDRGF